MGNAKWANLWLRNRFPCHTTLYCSDTVTQTREHTQLTCQRRTAAVKLQNPPSLRSRCSPPQSHARDLAQQCHQLSEEKNKGKGKKGRSTGTCHCAEKSRRGAASLFPAPSSLLYLPPTSPRLATHLRCDSSPLASSPRVRAPLPRIQSDLFPLRPSGSIKNVFFSLLFFFC
jgi:hypothetical protein